jgi:hypothetical protein
MPINTLLVVVELYDNTNLLVVDVIVVFDSEILE